MPVDPRIFAGPNIGQLYNDARNQRVQLEGQQQDRQMRVGELMQRKQEHATKTQWDQADRRTEILARMAASVRGVPYEQRRGALQQLAPQLQQMGIAPDEIAGFDPSDQQLDAYIALGGQQQQRPQAAPSGIQEYEYAKGQGYGGSYMDFLEGKRGPIVANNGDGTFTLIPRSMGGGGQPQSGGQAPRPLSSKAEYDALPPGSEYIAPDGSRRRKGGQAPQASGRFQP
jgi:hypothetical protein